jgi:hypothetical protein
LIATLGPRLAWSYVRLEWQRVNFVKGAGGLGVSKRVDVRERENLPQKSVSLLLTFSHSVAHA